MKRFYLKALMFAIILLSVMFFFDYLSTKDYWRNIIAKYTDSTDYIEWFPGTGEIKPYIEMVQRQDQTTKLIVGDSVCHQMFSGLQDYNKDVCIAGSNGAITMAGQYILVKEYLDNHPDATDVFLLVLPESLVRTFDTRFGYQYAVMPFIETGTLEYLDEDTIEIMKSVYGNFFMREDVVETIDLSGLNRKLYLNFLENHSDGYVLKNNLEIADRYICKIDELCKEKGARFYFLPCPMTEGRKDYVDELAGEFEISAIRDINPDYIKNIYFYSPEQTEDGSHFKGEYAERENLNLVIQKAYSEADLLGFLKLK